MNKKLRNCKKRLVNDSRYGIIHVSGDTTCFQIIHSYVKNKNKKEKVREKETK